MKMLWRLLKEQTSLLGLALLAIVLGCLMVASNLALLSVAVYLVAAASVASLFILLSVPIFLVRLIAVVRPLARYAERCVSHDLTLRLLTGLRTRVYACLEPLAPALLLHYRSGDLLTRLVADIDELQNIYLRILAPLVVAGIIMLGVFLVLFMYSPLLAWVALAFLVGAGVGVPLLSWWLARGIGEERLALRAEQQAALVDGMQGMQDLLVYNQTSTYLQKISSSDRRLGALQQRMAGITGAQEVLNDLLRQGALWCVLVLALPLVAGGQLDGIYVGALVLFTLASFEIVQPLGQACQFLGHSQAAGRRLFALLDAAPVVTDPPMPSAPPASDACELRFERVCFAYNPDDPAVLNEISLSLRPGRLVALVGSSGSGKSTLLRLLTRCWDPGSGRITLNGKDIRHYALAELRALMSVVTQDTHLFNTTLRANLLLAQPGASDEQLMQALEQVQLDEFARQLPHGLDTWLGEQGLRLSGGERQRVAIARALLKDAPILLLDEVTANLDPSTEREVLTTLRELARGRTTLLITHRLICMENVDEIIVLEEGAIQERGAHEKLLAQQGRYAQLFTIQESVLTFPNGLSSREE